MYTLWVYFWYCMCTFFAFISVYFADVFLYQYVSICIFCWCIFVFVFVSFLWWETWESCLLCGEESFSHILLWNKFAIHGFSCLRPHQSTHVICYCNILKTSSKTLFNFIILFISTSTRLWLFFSFHIHLTFKRLKTFHVKTQRHLSC